MKKAFIFLLVGSSVLLAQTKKWTQTSATDFKLGITDSTIVTDDQGGEVRLANPLVRQGDDTLDSSIPQYASYDDAGDYVTGWVNGSDVYVQKFGADNQQLTAAIRVDDSAGAFMGNPVSVALLDDGEFAVGWEALSPSSRLEKRYVQFFDSKGNKIGDNLELPGIVATGTIPLIIADQLNERYAIIFPQKVNDNPTYHLFGDIYSADGNKIRNLINIIPAGGTMIEAHPRGAFYGGRFLLAWEGFAGDVGPGDVYAAYYDSNLVPVTAPINMASQANEASVVFDGSGSACVTWVNNSGQVTGPSGEVYGQIMDSTGKKIGGVSQLTNISDGVVRVQSVTFSHSVFRVAWTLGFTDGRADQQWASYWKIAKITHGSYISSVFDGGPAGTLYRSLSWDGTTPSGTQLKFQLRTALTKVGLQLAPWLGPTSTSDFYTTSSGEDINHSNSPSRYLQAKVMLNSVTAGTTPVLTDFTVTYTSEDTTPPLPPSAVIARGEHRRVVLSWSKSTSPDVWRYYILRSSGVIGTGTPVLAEVGANQTSYIDSSVVYDSLYHYGVMAVDSALNESPIVLSAQASPKTMTVFVSTSGSPTGNGTMLNPFPSINDAVSFSGKGDTVYVLPGDYNGNVKLKDGVSLIGSGATTTGIIATDLLVNVLTTSGNNVVKGFTFQMGNGIDCQGDDVLVTENILVNKGQGFNVGILAGDYEDITISKNIILNFSLGIQSVASTARPSVRTTIRNNIIRCVTGVQGVSSNISLINNTIVVGASSGEAVSLTSGNALLINNCLVGYPVQGAYVGSVASGENATDSVEYDDIWGFNNDLPNSFGSTNISVDPKFVSATTNDFHLSSFSGCKHRGSPSAEYDNVDGTRDDIGAYGGPNPLPDRLTSTLMTQLSVNNVSGFPGDTASVGIISSDAAGMKVADIDVRYDTSQIRFLNATTTALTAGFTLNAEAQGGGKLTVSMEGDSEITSGSGNIVLLRFVFNPLVRRGGRSTIQIGLASLLDGKGGEVIVSSVTNGSCVVRSEVGYPSEIFVDASNKGATDGTILHPYTMIQEAIDNAAAGDTVIVAAGNYTAPISMRSKVFLLGLGANSTTIELPDQPLTGTTTVVSFNNVDSTGIKGFSLVNRSPAGSVVGVDNSGVVISKNRIEQSGGTLASVTASNNSKLDINDNYFVESESAPPTLIAVSGGTTDISGNVFSSPSGINAIELHSTDSSVVRNNTFHLQNGNMTCLSGISTEDMIVANNLFIGDSSSGSGINLTGADSTLIVNNIFDLGRNGIIEDNGTQQIFDNILVGNEVAFNIKASTVHQYNLLWDNKLNFGSGKLDKTEMIADPQFVNQSGGNYRLLPSSPAIHAGNPEPQWDNLDGTRNDIGIYGGPFADTAMSGAGNSRLYFEDVPGSPGDTVIVPIYARDISGIAGIRLSISYDPDEVTLVEAHTTGNTQGFVLSRDQIGNSMAELVLQGNGQLAVDSGAVVGVTFAINKNASGNIPLSLQSAQLVEPNTALVDGVATGNGTILMSPDLVNQKVPQIPKQFALYQNFPNPFNPSTTILFDLKQASTVTLEIYNVLGQRVVYWNYGRMQPGQYERIVNMGRYASGVYFYRLSAGSFVAVKKMVLIK